MIPELLDHRFSYCKDCKSCAQDIACNPITGRIRKYRDWIIAIILCLIPLITYLYITNQ